MGLRVTVQARWNERETAESSVGGLLLEPHTLEWSSAPTLINQFPGKAHMPRKGLENSPHYGLVSSVRIWRGRQGEALPLTQPDRPGSNRSTVPGFVRLATALYWAGLHVHSRVKTWLVFETRRLYFRPGFCVYLRPICNGLFLRSRSSQLIFTFAYLDNDA